MNVIRFGTNAAQNAQLYNDWAASYTTDTARWGYQLPQQAADFLYQHYSSSDNTDSNMRILDAGAGDGLTGVALRSAGFGDEAHISACDISPSMLRKAQERGCYQETHVVDLNQPPFDDTLQQPAGRYDIVQCIGTLTHISPTAGTLAELVRLTKPGGWVCFSHRTDQLEAWEPMQAALNEQWTLVAKLGPLPYLPHHTDYADKVLVVVFLYRKNNQQQREEVSKKSLGIET